MTKEKIKDVVAGIFSIIFIAVVFYLYFIQLFHGAFYFTFLSSDKIVIYNQTESNSCHINTVEPTIILRMDDVRAYSIITPYLVNEILERNISVTLGVIPKDLEKGNEMIKYLDKIKTNPRIEIAQHGNNHNETDKNITKDSLVEGYTKIQKVLGIVPTTYIPPYQEISPDSKEIISSYFKILSNGERIIKEGKKNVEIGYTEETYWFNKNKPAPIETIISKCKESLDSTNLCVIAIHPQEYAVDMNNALALDKNKFEEFKLLLGKLENLNARFSRFIDIVYCSS
mgnify:CR=1 FL=1